MYLNDSYYWNNENSNLYFYSFCPNYPGYHLDPLNDQIVANSTIPAVNVFFSENASAYQYIIENGNCPMPDDLSGIFPQSSCSEYASTYNFEFSPNVHMRNKYLKYYWMLNCVVGNVCENPEWVSDPPSFEEVYYSWMHIGRGVAHELAHLFRIGHVSSNTNSTCLDYLMNNWGTSWGNFITPIEISKMHQALSESSLRKYVTEDTYSSTPINVISSETWQYDQRIYRGVDISNGATLQITDNLIIPSETGISVSDASNLVINGASISTPHTNSVLQISATENSSVQIENASIKNCDINIQNSALSIDNATIELGTSGEFYIAVGSEFEMANSVIQ